MNRTLQNRMRGFTLIELLVVMAIIALLVGLLLPALARARATTKRTKDGTQIQQIHKAWVILAGEYDDRFPTPGLIRREPNQNGQCIPGNGAEDLLANTSDNMYSACIMANSFSPQVLLGPTEPSGFVIAMDNYNWELYSPLDCIYWDEEFETILPEPGESPAGAVCHASYSHNPIAGARKRREWKATFNSKFAAIANRGVKGGALDSATYNESRTLEIHGSRKEWVGNICYNDGHVEVEKSFFPQGVRATVGGEDQPDNIYFNDVGGNLDSGSGDDIYLTLVSDITGNDPANQTIVSEWD